IIIGNCYRRHQDHGSMAAIITTMTRALTAKSQLIPTYQSPITGDNSPAVIFIGDFNARHCDFGDTDSNEHGIALSNYCHANDLTILNTLYCNGIPTFVNKEHSAILDLAITN